MRFRLAWRGAARLSIVMVTAESRASMRPMLKIGKAR